MKAEKIKVPVEDRVPIKERLAYSFGFGTKDAITTVINTFLMAYLMQIVGINFEYIGIMMLACRVFDAFMDPIIGQIADHAKFKNGRYRPFIRTCSILWAIIFVCLMFVPDIGILGKTIWVTVFYFLWSIFYTLVEIPYFGILPSMTNSPHERGTVTSWSRIASRISAVGVPILVGVLVNSHGNKAGYGLTGLIIGVLVIIGGFVAYNGCHERVRPEVKERAGFRSFGKVIKGNWALLIIMAVQLFFTFNTILGDMINTLYIQHYLSAPALSAYLIAPVTAGMILGQLLVPQFQKITGGGRKTVIVGLIAYLVMLFVCNFTGHINIPLWVISMFVLNMFGGAMQILIVMLCFDNADYIEYKTGERADATIFASVSFLMKVAAGLASSIAAFSLAFAGFTMRGPGEGANVEMLATIRYVVPAILVVLSIIFAFIYPVKDAQLKKIREELLEKHKKMKEEEKQA